MSVRARYALDACLVIGLAAAGVALRLRGLPYLQLDENTIYPYTQGLFLLAGWATSGLPQPEAFDTSRFWPHTYPDGQQFGPGLVWAHLPLLLGANSLEESLTRRLLVQATAAPLIYIGVRVALAPRPAQRHTAPRWPSVVAALAAATVVGFTGFPFGPFSPYDDTYLAPEMCSWITACAVVVLGARRTRWLLPCLPLVVVTCMVHPFSVAYTVGSAFLLLIVLARGESRVVLGALGLASLAAVPEVVHLLSIFGTQADDLGSIARSCDDQRRTVGALFGRSWSYMSRLQPRPLGHLVALAPIAAVVALGLQRWISRPTASRGVSGLKRLAHLPRTELIACWCLANIVGFVVATGVVGCVQPWHWGIVLPSLAVALALVVHVAARLLAGSLQRRAPAFAPAAGVVAVLLAVLLAMFVMRYHDVDYARGFGSLQASTWLSRTIQEDAGASPRWIDAITLDHDATGYPWIYPPALFIDQRLRDGISPGSFHPRSPLYLVVDGSPEQAALVADLPGGSLLGTYEPDESTRLLLVRLDDRAASRQWTESLCHTFPEYSVRTHLDAVDYFGEIRGGADRAAIAPWFAPCVVP